MTPVMYRVAERRDDQPGTVTLGLEPVADAIASPAPGQFNMLWSFGIGEAPISLAGLDAGLIRHTIRRVGAVTSALCDLGIGAQVGVRGPFGRGWPVATATGGDVVIVAGGLGAAPVRPLVEFVMAQRSRFGRVAVLFGTRDPNGLLYHHEYDRWRDHDIAVEVTVDAASSSWRGNVGLVTDLVERADFDAAHATAFVCGPEVMMRFVAQSLCRRGVDPRQVLVSLERNMHCAVGHCGHCQLGSAFVCMDGPVFDWVDAEPLLRVRAL